MAKKKAAAKKKASAAIRSVRTAGSLQLTISGDAVSVRRALTALRFEGVWGKSAAREIALDATLVFSAELDDELGGQKLSLFSQDARDLYRQRCVNEAGRQGHPVVNPSNIPADADTKVREVGDALFANARP